MVVSARVGCDVKSPESEAEHKTQAWPCVHETAQTIKGCSIRILSLAGTQELEAELNIHNSGLKRTTSVLTLCHNGVCIGGECCRGHHVWFWKIKKYVKNVAGALSSAHSASTRRDLCNCMAAGWGGNIKCWDTVIWLLRGRNWNKPYYLYDYFILNPLCCNYLIREHTSGQRNTEILCWSKKK